MLFFSPFNLQFGGHATCQHLNALGIARLAQYMIIEWIATTAFGFARQLHIAILSGKFNLHYIKFFFSLTFFSRKNHKQNLKKEKTK